MAPYTTPYFHTLNEKDYQKVVKHARRRTYLPGDVIVRERTLTDTFCIIETGKVEITKKFTDGEEMTLALMEAGDFFGEMAFGTGGTVPDHGTPSIGGNHPAQYLLPGTFDPFHPLPS
jgi:CRP-like cAMP-binding protein